jgi:predicted DNA-binding transcriptional regulator AlpA
LDQTLTYEIIQAQEAADFLKMSLSWIYDHYQELGGRKIGGTVLFPSRGEIYERLFGQQAQNVAVRFSAERESVSRLRLCDQKRSSKRNGRAQKADNYDPHGILNLA